jgi:hypothetical protein
VLIVDHLLLNRLAVGSVWDVFNCYVYAFVYVCFNVVYTLWIPGATGHNGDKWVYETLAWRHEPARAGIVVGATSVFVLPLCWGLMCGVTTLRDGKLFPLRASQSQSQSQSQSPAGEEGMDLGSLGDEVDVEARGSTPAQGGGGAAASI